MSLDSSQIVHSLIAFYKRRGADLTYMLGDPIFDKLPLEDKVEAIKTHGAYILAHSPESLNREEKSLIKGEAIAGGITAGAALLGIGLKYAKDAKYANAAARNTALGRAGLVAAVGGLGAGYLLGKFKSDSLISKRKAIRSELQRVAHNPSTENAIGALSTGYLSQQLAVSRNNLLNKIVNKIDQLALAPVADNTEKFFKEQYQTLTAPKN